MSKLIMESSAASVSPSDGRLSQVYEDSTGNSTSSTNPFRRSMAEKSKQHTGDSTSSASRRVSGGKPPAYHSQRASAEMRKDAFSTISVPERRSLESFRQAPTLSSRPRRSSSLKERYPGDTSVRPLDTIAKEKKRADRAPHLRKHHQPRPDTIDILDDTGLNYHHEGPYDAALLVRNTSFQSSPVAALRETNAEALKATPKDKIRDSLNDHRPLDGTAIVPSGQRDHFGQLYDYEEGTDMMREPGADYKRWPGIKYLPEDLKGKGEPSYSIERALKEHNAAEKQYAANGNQFELTERPRHGGTQDGDVESSHRRGHSRSHNLSGEIKRRLGSLRRKDK